MDKEKILEMLDFFEKLKCERDAQNQDIYMSLDIISSTCGGIYHTLFVKKNSKSIGKLCHLKGFLSLTNMPEIETFEDVLELVGEVKNG